jgi:hypothetical protein
MHATLMEAITILHAEPHSAVVDVAHSNLVVTKVIVAVHGVDDQFNYATLQSVKNELCAYYQQPLAMLTATRFLTACTRHTPRSRSSCWSSRRCTGPKSPANWLAAAHAGEGLSLGCA